MCRHKEVDAAPAFSVAIYKLNKIPGLLMSEARCAQENPKLSTKEMGQSGLFSHEPCLKIFTVVVRHGFFRVGIELPTIEVRYENLTIEADCYVGDRALPTLWNSTRNILEV